MDEEPLDYLQQDALGALQKMAARFGDLETPGAPKVTLHCGTWGRLRPEDVAPGECAVILTGSEEQVWQAMRTPGVAMGDVVILSAYRWSVLLAAVKTIATMGEGAPGEDYVNIAQMALRELGRTKE